MGWWWSSSPKKDSETVTLSTPTPEPAAQNAPPKKLTPDEQADYEFSQILSSLQEADASLTRSLNQDSNGSTSTSASPSAIQEQQTPTSPIAPESLYADTMSCRTAFDYAFFCQSFGGQFVNVYRYGELRSCSENWDNFWLCMKTRGWGDELRKKTIRDHNRKKAVKYKTGPSSEDIWDVRLDPAKNSFQGDFAALELEIKAEEEAQKAKAAV
ncbi:hypothetical protein N7495_008875 [Penicillium taxi]|uniref:uncharacterized protein n=1 Tax=Penicillium taxi TaxID=168475 RepID=UPI002545447C|nr:uncharacterized protein N7495_008875 [Penicillium taxi]KAJ5888834.1 hypothetical protein N7495_008875 [Penicillium taxi]